MTIKLLPSAAAVILALGLSFAPSAGPAGMGASAQPGCTERCDHTWQPPSFGIQGSVASPFSNMRPLGSGSGTRIPLPVEPAPGACVPNPTLVAQSQCIPLSGSWGAGSIQSYYSDGCGGQQVVDTSCAVACQPRKVSLGAGACVANVGSYGDGKITETFKDGCGNTSSTETACTIPAPPDPPKPTGDTDKIIVCQDFEEYSVRQMPMDFSPGDESRVWGSPGVLRWDNRHSCLYEFPGTNVRGGWGSPWYCTAWGHPDPEHGYCYVENPRYAYFLKWNHGEKDLRDHLRFQQYTSEEQVWAAVKGNLAQFDHPWGLERILQNAKETDDWKVNYLVSHGRNAYQRPY